MDERLLLMINQGWAHPWLDGFFLWISGRAFFSFPLLGLILFLAFRRFRMDGVKLWLLLVGLVVAGDVAGDGLKHITAQPRPCLASYDAVRLPGRPRAGPCSGNLKGMPSNHALIFFAVATFLSYVWRNRAWAAGLFAIALLVSISRIYLAKHYPSQVLAGALMGMALGWVTAWGGIKYLVFLQRIHGQGKFSPAHGRDSN